MKCHEFFECKKTDCIMFKEKETRFCWEIDPGLTPCINHVVDGLEEMKDKLSYCRDCLYYGYTANGEELLVTA